MLEVQLQNAAPGLRTWRAHIGIVDAELGTPGTHTWLTRLVDVGSTYTRYTEKQAPTDRRSTFILVSLHVIHSKRRVSESTSEDPWVKSACFSLAESPPGVSWRALISAMAPIYPPVPNVVGACEQM